MLTGSGVTDDVLDRFTRMPFMKSLSALNLHDTAVTDKGLSYIARHQTIATVGLGQSNLTDAGVKNFAEAMPSRCAIAWDRVTKKP
jgi:hypothetical protein